MFTELLERNKMFTFVDLLERTRLVEYDSPNHLYRVSWKNKGAVLREEPHLPPKDVTAGQEDEVTPRVSMAPSVHQAIAAAAPPYDEQKKEYSEGKEWYVYQLTSKPKLHVPSRDEVSDSYISGEIWALEPVVMELVMKVRITKAIYTEVYDQSDYTVIEDYR